jgi:hypothetical protein
VCSVPSCSNYLVIAHKPDDGTANLYLHFEHSSVLPSIGDWINRGCQIGTAGKTGWRFIHLHFQKEMKPTRRGAPLTQSLLITSGSTPLGFSNVLGGVPLHTDPSTAYPPGNVPSGPC